jgi:hypothetical protein
LKDIFSIAGAALLSFEQKDPTMTPQKINIADLPEFDMAEHLDSDQAIAEYLSIVLEENDPAEFAHALGTIARVSVAN